MSLTRIVNVFKKQPRYSLMRAVARFKVIRWLVCTVRHYWQKKEWIEYKQNLRKKLDQSIFSDIDIDKFIDDLKQHGVAFGLTLPAHVIKNIGTYAKKTPCYADRDPSMGFKLESRKKAEEALGKPILIAQYYNASHECPEVTELHNDPFLLLVAAEYFGSMPTYLGTNMWWTFPVNASVADRTKHAHVFHQDLDDFAFLKFFFYLTDVEKGDGGHVCIPGSHENPPKINFSDNYLIRRWSDKEMHEVYGEDNILEISAPAGTGFSENTFCMHKGTTPHLQPRLLLQYQFALFNHGLKYDDVPEYQLRQLV